MDRLWNIYHYEIPQFLREFAQTPPMRRLQAVGMNCGCEYTEMPLFARIRPYTRYDHSLGVALIVWHFTQDRAQALAGLFHDVTTPVFAHTVDFLNGDFERQESTEAGVKECLEDSPEVTALLARYGLTVEDVCDYHRYPIADNDTPALSADRLEYTLGNLLNYGFADLQTVRGFYEDLTVGQNEQGRPELVFRTPETACAFTAAALKNSRVYVADEDRAAMMTVADILNAALTRGVLRRSDLRTTEPEVLRKLEEDEICRNMWQRFCACSRVVSRPYCGEDFKSGWMRVSAKKRWIDPISQGRGRVSHIDANLSQQIQDFLALDFSNWIRLE